MKLLLFVVVLIVLISLVIYLLPSYKLISFLSKPLNALMGSPIDYHFTDDLTLFPYLSVLEENHLAIREEGIKLFSKYHQARNHLGNFVIDFIDRTGWNTIPVTLFGRESNIRNEVPITYSLIKKIPQIRSCIFSLLEPGKTIAEHKDPYNGILRVQLALDIPEGECYLTVSGKKYYWKQGKCLIFDNHKPHSVVNNTDKSRMVLMLDILKPYQGIRKKINDLIMGSLYYLPNTIKSTLI